MAIHPRLSFAAKNLKVAYQTTKGWQELRITLRLPTAFPGEKVGRSGMVDVGTAITWGSVGGKECPPWESEWEVTSPFNAPATKDGLLFEHVARVKGVSHRYIPHLVHHMGILRREFGDVTEMTVTGSAPIVDANSITEADVVPWLSDPACYPGRWPEPEFPLDLAKAKKHKLGVEVELVNEPNAEQEKTLQLRLGGWMLLMTSFADERGALVDSLKQLAKGPTLFGTEKKMVRAISTDLRHAHAPSRDAVANMLMNIHAKVAPIARATITSRAGDRDAHG